MDERLAQVLGAAFARGLDRVRLAVVLDHVRVVDGDVVRLLVEVLDRIAALAHDLGHERVGVGQRARRLIDELGLRRPPALGVALARRRLERADVIGTSAVEALAQLGFTVARAALFDHAVVLRTEAFAQLGGAALPHEQHADDAEQHDDDGYE